MHSSAVCFLFTNVGAMRKGALVRRTILARLAFSTHSDRIPHLRLGRAACLLPPPEPVPRLPLSATLLMMTVASVP